MSAPKAKAYSVSVLGTSYLVFALTKQGAINNLIDHLRDGDAIYSEVATGEQLYNAGREGISIIAEEKYRRVVDKDQLPLEGLDTAVGGTD